MDKITFPSGVYYVKNKKDIANSLFEKGGTASGYYKKYKNKIIFYNLQDEPFLCLACNGPNDIFFVSCRKLDNGKLFYFLAVSSNIKRITGLDTLGYTKSILFAEKVWQDNN